MQLTCLALVALEDNRNPQEVARLQLGIGIGLGTFCFLDLVEAHNNQKEEIETSFHPLYTSTNQQTTVIRLPVD
jgi:hypothetical protein